MIDVLIYAFLLGMLVYPIYVVSPYLKHFSFKKGSKNVEITTLKEIARQNKNDKRF